MMAKMSQHTLGLMQESDEGVSEADASDADEDAEAKAERLGIHQASRDDVQPASASRAAGGFPQAAGKKRASPANAEGSNKKSKREYQLDDLMNGSNVKQKSSKKKRKAARQPDAMSNGSASREMELQPEATAADLQNSAQGEGYEPYRRDVLADVARQQREHLLGTKIGTTTSCCQQTSYCCAVLYYAAAHDGSKLQGSSACSGGVAWKILIALQRCPQGFLLRMEEHMLGKRKARTQQPWQQLPSRMETLRRRQQQASSQQITSRDYEQAMPSRRAPGALDITGTGEQSCPSLSCSLMYAPSVPWLLAPHTGA